MNNYVLITGGAGFIGSHMALKLRSEGYKIVIIDNLFRGSLNNLEDLLDEETNLFFNIDLTTEDSVIKLGEILTKYRPEIIIHYAAINGTQYFYDEPRKVAIVNSISSNNLINALKLWNSRPEKLKLYFASTSEVYGEPNEIPTCEKACTYVRSTMDRDSYSCAKLMSEFFIRLGCKELNIDYVILRIFNVYGPKMIGSKYGQVIPEFISRILEDEYPLNILGNGRHTRSFCYISDHVDLTFKLIKKGVANEIINLGNPNEISIISVAEKIFKILNLKPSFNFLEEREGDHLRRCPDIRKLEKLTGRHSFIELDEGLVNTINFYKSR